MASIGTRIDVVGIVHEKQMRRSADNEEFRYDRCPLPARVSFQDLLRFRIRFESSDFPVWRRFLATLVAVFGEYDISGELEKKRSVTKNIKRIVVHREYDAATFENDLALLEMESPIHYDTHIGEYTAPPQSIHHK